METPENVSTNGDLSISGDVDLNEIDRKMTIAILFGDEFYDLELKQRTALEYLLFDLGDHEKARILFNRYRGFPDNW